MSVIDNFEKMENTCIRQDSFFNQNKNGGCDFKLINETKNKDDMVRGMQQRKHQTEVRRRETDNDDSDNDVEMSESNRSPSGGEDGNNEF